MKHTFSAHTTIRPNQTTWETTAVETQRVGIPTAFGGEEVTSPEDLLALALNNCYSATYTVIAKKSNFNDYTLHAETTIYVETQPLAITHANQTITIHTTNPQKARTIAEAATRNCLVHKTLNIPIETTIHTINE